MIKVKEKTFTRHSHTTIFDWKGGPKRKSHAIMLSKFFKKSDFLWDKDIVKRRIRSGGLGWHVTRILLKGKDLNQKFKNFPKLSKLADVVSKLV